MALRDVERDGRAVLLTLQDVLRVTIDLRDELERTRFGDGQRNISGGEGGGGAGGSFLNPPGAGGGIAAPTASGTSSDAQAIVESNNRVKASVDGLRADLAGDGGAGLALRGGL